MYETLTAFAGELAGRKSEDDWGTCGLDDFTDAFYHHDAFYNSDGYTKIDYFETLERYGVEMSDESFAACDVEHANAELACTLIMTLVRQDRLAEGLLGRYARNGYLDRCLFRLKELDEDQPRGTAL